MCEVNVTVDDIITNRQNFLVDAIGQLNKEKELLESQLHFVYDIYKAYHLEKAKATKEYVITYRRILQGEEYERFHLISARDETDAIAKWMNFMEDLCHRKIEYNPVNLTMCSYGETYCTEFKVSLYKQAQ